MQLQCQCGNILCERIGEYVVVNHRRRRLVLQGVVLVVQCERCGREVSPPALAAVGAGTWSKTGINRGTEHA